jgi:hypothetical protein
MIVEDYHGVIQQDVLIFITGINLEFHRNFTLLDLYLINCDSFALKQISIKTSADVRVLCLCPSFKFDSMSHFQEFHGTFPLIMSYILDDLA